MPRKKKAAGDTKKFEGPITLHQVDPHNVKCHAQMPPEIRSNTRIALDLSVLPGDYEPALYDVSGKMTIELTVTKK